MFTLIGIIIYSVIGYKTTENREEALYNISLLDMNGGFQIRDYKELYDEYQKSNYGAAETLQMATMDFIDSYNEGSPRAIDAYEGLNLLYVPEAENIKFGDYVIQGKTSTDFYTRVLTQASTGTVNAIISLLSAGLAPYTLYTIEEVDDDEETQDKAQSWADKMSDSPLWDIADSDDLSQDEKDEYYRQYGDDAKALFRQMQDFATRYENSLAIYDEEAEQKKMAGSSLEDMVENMDKTDESDTAALYIRSYEMLNEYDANSDMPLGEWIVEMGKQTSDEVDLTQIYPMIDSMSYAQVRMTELTGFVSCASNLGENVRSEECQKIFDETRKKLQELVGNDSISIWTNTDPDMRSKKVAFTSKAIRENAAQSLLNGQLDDTYTEAKEIIENVIKWIGFASSALIVLSFVAGQYFVDGLLILIAKYAAAATLLSVSTTMVTVMASVFKYAGYVGLAVLGVTILFAVFCAIYEWAMKNSASDYTTMPDYVIDSVKQNKGYASVKYKAVRGNRSRVGDLNGQHGFRGWVCMYTSTDPRVGSPIRADSDGTIFRIFYGNSSKPDDCDCANFFGQITPGNCNTNMKKDNVGGIYINYYTEKSLKNRSKGIPSGPEPGQKPDITAPEKKQYYHEAIKMKSTAEAKEKETAAQLNQAIYDIVCTVGEPFKPDGFVSQRYQIYYAPVISVDKNNNNAISGVNLNDGTIGPEIYMYYTSPYAAKEYNERVKSDRRAILSSMPNDYFSAPITKIALCCWR